MGCWHLWRSSASEHACKHLLLSWIIVSFDGVHWRIEKMALYSWCTIKLVIIIRYAYRLLWNITQLFCNKLFVTRLKVNNLLLKIIIIILLLLLSIIIMGCNSKYIECLLYGWHSRKLWLVSLLVHNLVWTAHFTDQPFCTFIAM